MGKTNAAEMPGASAVAVTIPAALLPADAAAMRAKLSAARDRAAAEGAVLEIEIEGARALPCAVQLLVAAARAEGPIAPCLGPNAAALHTALSDTE